MILARDGCDGTLGRHDEQLEQFRQVVHTHGQVTLMIQNIACKFTKEDLKDILDDLGLRGKFSFVAVPRVHTRRANFGYAFACFRSAEAAQECFALCSGRVLGPTNTKKTCEVSLARVQGSSESVLRHRGQRDREAELLPCDDYVVQAWLEAAGGGTSAAAVSSSQALHPCARQSREDQRVTAPLGAVTPRRHAAPDMSDVPDTVLRSSGGAGTAARASASRTFTADASRVRAEDIFGDTVGLPEESLSCPRP
mmetsp:Transcript_62149/g.173627  ORF Transcript_62149/g.173627 Transcript_62149/m.173627 type:complete len:253 (+) Transcript_62149:29-787(+)